VPGPSGKTRLAGVACSIDLTDNPLALPLGSIRRPDNFPDKFVARNTGIGIIALYQFKIRMESKSASRGYSQ